MTIEDTLRSSLAERLDSLDVPPGDLSAALQAGSRRRSRRATGWGVAAACLVLVGGGVAVAIQRGDAPEPSPAPAPGTGWTRLPDSPLSPRANGLMIWTGSEALVIGGEVDHLCPPTADCASASTIARDGAAYDPAARTWRGIAPAPADLAAWTPYAVVDDTVVVVAHGVDDAFFAYDVSDDAWRPLPPPPTDRPKPLDIDTGLSAFDGRVYAVGSDGAVLVLDPVAGTWSTLPASPHRPWLEAHYVTGTPEGIVVLGVDATAVNDGTVPSLLLAEVWEGEAWRRLGTSEILGGWAGWHWTGERLVSPYAECLDGGQTNNYGRCIPTGGALDPASGEWQPLDAAPSMSGWTLSAAAGPLVATWGHVYDDTDRSWTRIEQPDGAPSDGTAATFADGTLLAFGGVDWGDGLTAETSDGAWAWTP